MPVQHNGMIERYTIKFGLAITQKEMEKLLHESGDTRSSLPTCTR